LGLLTTCDQVSHMSDPGDTRGQQDHTGGCNHPLHLAWWWRWCCLAVLQLYLFPPHEQLLAAVVLGPGVVAVSAVLVVLRLRRCYNMSKIYH
jgi:hypothetical protein